MNFLNSIVPKKKIYSEGNLKVFGIFVNEMKVLRRLNAIEGTPDTYSKTMQPTRRMPMVWQRLHYDNDLYICKGSKEKEKLVWKSSKYMCTY